MNKTKYVFFCVIFSFFVSYAQDSVSERVELEWNESTSVITSRNNNFEVPTVKNQFLDDNLLPIYTKSWKIAKGYAIDSYKITNVNYQIITFDFSKNNSLNKIPATIQSKLNVASSRDESEVILTLTPLIKEGANIKKVVSFNIEYKLKRKLSSRLTNSKTAFNSVLSSGTWYKFSIDTTGVFKIDRSFLSSLGLNASSINPKNIKIYGNGGNMLPFLNSDFRYDSLEENAIFVSGEEDNKFDANDFILFYAKGPDTWKVDTSVNNTRHQKNIFSDKSYYFITVDEGIGKRIQNDIPLTSVPTQQIASYNDYDFYEKEEHNIIAIGQQWFGENLTIENVQTFTIPFESIDTSQDLQIRVRGVVESETTSQMAVKVNGQDLYTINFPAITSSLVHAVARENIGNISATNEAVTVEITFNNNGNPSAKAHLDYIEVIGKKLLTVDDKQFGFRSFDVANGS